MIGGTSILKLTCSSLSFQIVITLEVGEMRFCNLVLPIAYDSLKEIQYFHDADVILPCFLK